MDETPNNPVTPVEPDARARYESAVEWAKESERADVRVRCELRLYNPLQNKYVSWNDAYWTVNVKAEIESGMQLKAAFDAFFAELLTKGPESIREKLAP
jgi:hypothetical protein